MKKKIISVVSAAVLTAVLCTSTAFADKVTEVNVNKEALATASTTGSSLAVTNLRVADVTENTVSLQWDRVEGANGAEVEVFLDGKWVTYFIAYENSDFAYMSALPSGTVMQFRVRMFTGCEGAYVYGEYSEVVEATTLLKKMDKPSIGGRTSTALRLNWNKYNDADGYIIEKYDGAKWTRVKKLTNNQTTTYRIEGLEPSTKYQFRIRAYTISGTKAVYGEYSDAVTGYTNPSVVSGLKIGGRAVSALRLNWTKNSSADGYIIEQYDGTKWVRIKKLTDSTVATYRVEGLFSGTTYKFRMRAYKMNGGVAYYGGYTATVSGTTVDSAIPQNIKQTSNTSTSATVSWNAVSGAKGYSVQIYKNGKWVTNNKVTKNSYTFSKLSRNTSYKIRVRSYDGSKYSSFSPVMYIAATPSAPTGLEWVSGSVSSFTVSWNKVTGVSGYEVQVLKSGKWYTYKTTDTSYRVTGLLKDNKFSVRVRAYMNVSGKTVYSSFSSTITTDTYTAESRKYYELVDYLIKNGEKGEDGYYYLDIPTDYLWALECATSLVYDVDKKAIYILIGASNNETSAYLLGFYLYPYEDEIYLEAMYIENGYLCLAESTFSRTDYEPGDCLTYYDVYTEPVNESADTIAEGYNQILAHMLETVNNYLRWNFGYSLDELGFSAY